VPVTLRGRGRARRAIAGPPLSLSLSLSFSFSFSFSRASARAQRTRRGRPRARRPWRGRGGSRIANTAAPPAAIIACRSRATRDAPRATPHAPRVTKRVVVTCRRGGDGRRPSVRSRSCARASRRQRARPARPFALGRRRRGVSVVQTGMARAPSCRCCATDWGDRRLVESSSRLRCNITGAPPAVGARVGGERPRSEHEASTKRVPSEHDGSHPRPQPRGAPPKCVPSASTRPPTTSPVQPPPRPLRDNARTHQRTNARTHQRSWRAGVKPLADVTSRAPIPA
jgi:hypothetical protein